VKRRRLIRALHEDVAPAAAHFTEAVLFHDPAHAASRKDAKFTHAPPEGWRDPAEVPKEEMQNNFLGPR